MGDLVLVRHGETEWSRDGRHTGRTDVALTVRGEEQARSLAPVLGWRTFAAIRVSPATRARRTAELAGVTAYDVDGDLWEWDYGGYEGQTSAEIRRDRSDWYLWDDGVVPGDIEHPGEAINDVGKRVDRVLERVAPALDRGDVALVAHGHVLRVLAARWLRLPPADGRLFVLATGTASTLGREHGRPAMLSWNAAL